MEKPDLGGLVAKVMLSAGSISSSVPAVACDGCREGFNKTRNRSEQK